MEPDAATTRETIRFEPDFELDVGAWELRRSGRAIRLERIPMEILLLLVRRRGQLVTRAEIVQEVWGQNVYLDTDNSINAAVRKLRQALREDVEKPRVIQTVPGKGYRFIANVAAGNGHGAEVPAVAQPAPPADAAPRSAPRRSRLLVSGFLAPLVAIGVFAFVESTRRRGAVAPKTVMLAVLPFENLTGDREQDYFSDGLTEEMISRLGNLDPRRLAVIARTSVMQYKRQPKTLAQIGRELNVNYVLEGSVRREQGRARISAQLIRVSDETHLWARQYDRELVHLLAVQEEIAQAVADQIEITLAPRRIGSQRPSRLSRATYEAYDLYLKGRYFWNKRTANDFERAAEAFQKAAQTDPTYARAYAGLADTYGLMSSYFLGSPSELIPRARSAALRALELDERLPEAHTSLALISEAYDWDWATAEKEFRRAIELDPNYATAHQWYAELLAFEKRFDEAFAESRRAVRLDPLSLIIATDDAAILYLARRYDEAIAEFRDVLQKQPDFHRPYMLIWAYTQKGMFPEALAEVEKWRRESDEPWNWAAQAYVYGRSGRAAEAGGALVKLERFARAHPSDPMPMMSIAYLGVDEKERALAWLEKSVRERSPYAMWLKADPLLDPLREDSRFQELLRRVGFA